MKMSMTGMSMTMSSFYITHTFRTETYLVLCATGTLIYKLLTYVIANNKQSKHDEN